ncbi:phage tail family protein [Staphylococcus sp. IVB6181]|uniref:phage tail family protein n=1 Tax=Staphylococcus sp. IVB6181 TaxID=2929481 RepID=UPI0021D26062|nr:phage tail family protein [Staphylococcus sp. IVB6181]UXV34486.1 phage tail family protein [Staphylococcus sp. IVB6181]
MNDTVIVNDKTLPWLFVQRGFKIPSFNFEVKTKEVPVRRGSVYQGRELKQYAFELPLVIHNDYLSHNGFKSHDDILNELVKFLNYDQEVKLQFKSKSWYWNAFFEGPIELFNKTENQINVVNLKVVLTDPYKYAIKGNKNTAISDQVSIVNSGTADTPIIVEARALKPSSYFMITKGDKDYFMIGDDNVNKVYKNYLPSIYSSEITTMVDWSKQSTIDFTDNYTGGGVGGYFKQSETKDSVYLEPESVEGKGWIGGMYKRSYTKSAQDFRSSVRFIIGQKNKGAVRAAQYIYDTDNRVIASLGYVNPSPTQNIGRVIITLFDQSGNQRKVYEYANSPKVQRMNDFVIYVQIKRVGNEFTLRSWKYTDQKQRVIFDEHRQVFTDRGNFYKRPVSSVSVYEGKHGTDKTFPVFIAGTFNHEILPKPQDANDMIIKEGDNILIDTRSNLVMVNEESFLTEKSFGSNFFNIDSGHTELMIYPEKTFDTTVKWQDRYY